MKFRGFKILLDGNSERTMATVIDPAGAHKRATFIRTERRAALLAANAYIIKRTGGSASKPTRKF